MSKTVLKWVSLPKRFKRPPDSRSRIAFVDAGYRGDAPAEAAKEHGIRLEVVKLQDGERRLCPGFRDDGWSNAPSPARHESFAWCAMMSGVLLLWLACTWSCLPV
jgi:hypothetical protein